MIKLSLTTVFALVICLALLARNLEITGTYQQLALELPLQDCNGQILGWYDACINSNLFRAEALNGFAPSAFPAFYLASAALLFSLVFLWVLASYAYVNAAYQEYENGRK